jgi:hypothetical protein
MSVSAADIALAVDVATLATEVKKRVNVSMEAAAVTAVQILTKTVRMMITALVNLTANSPTLTPAQIINAIITASGQTGAQTVTTPTAADIVAAIPSPEVGTSFEFTLRNEHTSSGAITMQAGAGVTLDGTTNVPITKTQVYRGVITNVATPAVTIYGLLTAAI